MATTAERLGIVETKVAVLDEKIDNLKTDVKEVHDCLDRTGDELKAQLKLMHDESCRQHLELAGKISNLEQTKKKFTLYGVIFLAFAAGAGWVGNPSMHTLLKFIGL